MISDLLTVLHDIDRMRGKSCATCIFNRWRHNPRLKAVLCQKGHDPCDNSDGCDDWWPCRVWKADNKGRERTVR